MGRLRHVEWEASEIDSTGVSAAERLQRYDVVVSASPAAQTPRMQFAHALGDDELSCGTCQEVCWDKICAA
jgi:hypothetical protein